MKKLYKVKSKRIIRKNIIIALKKDKKYLRDQNLKIVKDVYLAFKKKKEGCVSRDKKK